MIEYWRSRLEDNSKGHYDLIATAIKQQKRSVALPVSINDIGEIQKVFHYVMLDHPELYYVSPQISVARSILSLTVNFSYLYENKQQKEIEASFENFKKAIVNEGQQSELQKAHKAIFLLMRQSKYEINNLNNQNAAAAIHFHSAQCSGFAAALKYIMDFIGIWCIVVAGTASDGVQSGPHAWNIVKINGLYHHIDITGLAKATLTEVNDLLRYHLFESDKQKQQRGYIWDSAQTPPCCEIELTNKQNLPEDKTALPTFTRMFDAHAKIRECIQKRQGRYEFFLNIPTYSNEKLMRMIVNDISELREMLSVSLECKLECINNKMIVTFNYKN